MNKLFFIISIFLFSFNSYSQVSINEFMAQNQTGITDNYGEYEDWIEIYNPTSSDFNLAGLYISDNLFSPLLYQIPFGNDSTIIPAGGFIILWADDDIEQGVLHLSFKLTGGGEQIGLFDGMGNSMDTISFGYQNGDVSFGRSPNGSSNLVFFSESTPGASNLTTYLSPFEVNINLPYSNNYSYVVDVNSNINWSISNSASWLSISPLTGSNNGSFTVSTTQHNSTGSDRNTIITLSGSGVNDQTIFVNQYSESNNTDLVINEFLAQNDNITIDNFGEYDDWIEIYNKGNIAINMAGLFLTDNLNNPLKFKISELYPDSTFIQPGEFLLFWADDDTEQGIFHLNFKLSNNGEDIGLFNNEYDEIDALTYGPQDADISYGRSWDGSNSWDFFSIPTPGYSNSMEIDETSLSSFNIYPNPATNYFIVESTGHDIKTLSIYNIYGEIVIQTSYNDKLTLVNTSSLSSGIYLLKISSEKEIYSKKIIIN